ncbi:MAG: zinc ribbon domain-containing protein [Bacteroidales bacterium]|nr:zinc ribbon domain-containing protein [Bacteroidales bacterium]
MPLYEFRCQQCDYLFEQIQGYSADWPNCPVCGGETQRILSPASARFKGSGFHCTDYTHHGRVRHHHTRIKP